MFVSMISELIGLSWKVMGSSMVMVVVVLMFGKMLISVFRSILIR